MSRTKRLAKNTIILILSNGLQPVLSLFLVISITRGIGVEGIGGYSTILNYMAIFQVVTGFGLRNLLTREIAQAKEQTQAYLVAGSAIALVFAALCAVLMALVVSLLSDDPVVIRGGLVAALSLFAAALIDVYEGVISGHERLSQIGYASLAETGFRVAVSLAMIAMGFGIVALIWVHVISRYLKAIYYYICIDRKLARPIGRIDRTTTLVLLRQGWIFALIMITVIIYWRADIIMIESLKSTTEAGFYSAAYRFFLPGLVLVDSFVNSLFPVISNLFKSAAATFQRACQESLRVLVLITVPMAVAVSLEADAIILLLYGEALAPAIVVLQILIWSLVPYGVSQIFAYALVASGRQMADLKVNALSMASNIVLNLALIPWLGYLGATLATFISIILYVSYQLPYVFQKLLLFNTKLLFAGAVRVTLAAAAMAAFIIYLKAIHFLLLVPLAFLVYVAALFALGVITQNDRKLFMQLAKRTA